MISSPPSFHRSGKQGFTIIEIMVTLLILGVLAGFVMVRAGNNPAATVAEAEILRSHLRYAQSLAVQNNTATWSVLIGANGYTLQRNGAPAPTSLPDQNGPTRNFEAGVQAVAGLGILTFDPLGAPAATAAITLSDGNHTETITILGETGLIP